MRKIAIVDDVLQNTLLLKGYVSRLPNVQAVTFTDPVEALAWCTDAIPDLVLLDYLMPEMDGCEFLRRLRQISSLRDIPVIVITAEESRESLYRVLEAGASDFLRKPIDDLELIARARNMLDLRSRQLALARSERLAAAGQLTAGLAHDFNNILMIIEGYSQRILDLSGEAPPIESSAKQIIAAADKAKILTQGLLAFSRQQPVQKRVFCADTVIRDNGPLIMQAVDAQFEIKFELNATDVNLETDPHEFDQALLNLVVNARDAMSAKGGTIIIGTRVTTRDEITVTEVEDLAPGRYVEVYVLDHGPGMDEQVRQHALEPFFTTKPQGQGTGLGLSMVHGFCRRSRGDVAIDSEIGKGTNVTMALPITEKAISAKVDHNLEGVPRGDGRIILLIEDEVPLLELVTETLQRLDYKVLGASDGFEALDIACNYDGHIDLVLSDVVLPGISGIELAGILKERDPNVKIIFMSGYPGRVDKKYGELPEGSILLQKPVKPDELARAVYENIKG